MRHTRSIASNFMAVLLASLLVLSMMCVPAWASNHEESAVAGDSAVGIDAIEKSETKDSLDGASFTENSLDAKGVTSLDDSQQAQGAQTAGALSAADESRPQAIIEVAAEDALGFLYVESSIVSVGESENIVVGLTDENISIETATLEASRASDADVLTWSAVKHIDNTALFTVAFTSDDSIDGYLLHGVSYTADGKSYHIDFDAIALVGVSDVLDAAQDGDNTTIQEIIDESDEVSGAATAVYAFEVVSAELGATLNSADAVAAASENGTVAFAVNDDGSLEAMPSVAEAIEVSDNAVESDEGQGYSAATAIESLLGVEKAYASSNGNLVVALDPGHGGSDPGACANGLQEKDVNLKIAQYCRSTLETYSGVTVYMTRTADEYVGLQERVVRAVANGADVVVSIHCNAGGGSGAEVWVPNDSSWCYQATHVVGYELGSKILDKITALGIGYRGVYTRDCTSGDEYADGSLMDYYTIISASREYGIPGIIVEHAFIDNSSEASRLADDGFLQQLGQADAQGIAEQYGLTHFSHEKAVAFATRLYSSCLGRTPDPEGLAHQVAALEAGVLPAEIVYNFFNSAEFQGFGSANGEQIERVYQTMFGRASDPSGKAYWLQYLDNGMSIRSVIAGFSQAAEYKVYFASMGANNDSIGVYEPRDRNLGATSFAYRMYDIVLGRGAEVAGLNVQSGAIQGGMPCYQIAVNFFCSAEYTAKHKASSDIVIDCYKAILGRSEADAKADAAGRAYWEDRLAREGLESVVKGFCQSDEFEAICQSYGLESGMR